MTDKVLRLCLCIVIEYGRFNSRYHRGNVRRRAFDKRKEYNFTLKAKDMTRNFTEGKF